MQKTVSMKEEIEIQQLTSQTWRVKWMKTWHNFSKNRKKGSSGNTETKKKYGIYNLKRTSELYLAEEPEKWKEMIRKKYSNICDTFLEWMVINWDKIFNFN